MILIKVTANLKTLPSDYKSWYFTVACGNGPTISSTTSAESCSTVAPFSSPNVATCELKLHLYAHKLLPEREEHAEEKTEADVAVLIATRTVTAHMNESSHASDFKLKVSSGDLIETVRKLYLYKLEWSCVIRS